MTFFKLIFMAIVGLFSQFTLAEVVNQTCNRNQSSYTCLLCNCYHETRGESFAGKVAVAKTVLTRSTSSLYPNSICQVVYQRAQFSWTGDKINNNISISSNRKPADVEAFKECQKATNLAQSEGENGILYFYNPKKARPKWAKKMMACGTIDNHRFLVRKCGKKENPKEDECGICPKTLGPRNAQKTAPKKTSSGKSNK